MTEKLDCVVVGAGVVGLAVARALALIGREVVVLERESHVGMHTSSRNSEVIHAGIYYPQDSLKAELCVRGKKMLYRYCETRGIAYLRIGKLIVATNNDEIVKLEEIKTQAARNGVTDLRFVNAEEVHEIEPAVSSCGALLSPSTGIIDSHELMTALQGDIEEHGGAVVLNSAVSNLALAGDEMRFECGGAAFSPTLLVNSAGLWAQELVTKVLPGSDRCRFARGQYFSYQGQSPFRHLVYPVPVPGGLGIHATNDLGGSARFGPDVKWIGAIDYDFDDTRKPEFVGAIRRYFPDLDEERLVPGYTGIRPKVSGPGEPAADFVFQSEQDHGVRGLVNLYGIESPGLTACLAIGEKVRDLLT